MKRKSRVMKKLSALLTTAVLAAALTFPMGSAASYAVIPQGNQTANKTSYTHVPGRVLIEFKHAPTESFWEALGSRYGLMREQRLDTFRSLGEIAQEVRAASDADMSLGESCYTATLPNTDDAFMEVVLADLAVPAYDVRVNDVVRNASTVQILSGFFGERVMVLKRKIEKVVISIHCPSA